MSPVPDTRPIPDTWRHWVDPLPVLDTKSWVVLAVPETEREVVVAAVPVAFMKVKFWRVVEPFTRRLVMVTSPAFEIRKRSVRVERESLKVPRVREPRVEDAYQCFKLAPALGSERRSCGPVEVAI